MTEAKDRVIIIGGGLAGLTTACECLERGVPIVIMEKMERLGGNSSKAAGGICAPNSRIQKALGVKQDDMRDLLEQETTDAGERMKLCRLLETAGKDVDWLLQNMGLIEDLVLYKTPGHAVKRTLGVSKKFPGQLITYTCVLMLQKIAEVRQDLVKIMTNVSVKKLLQDGGKVVGVEYVNDANQSNTIRGPVVLASGGFAGLHQNSLIHQHGKDKVKFGSTNDDRSDGSGIRLAGSVGAAVNKMDRQTLFPNCFAIDPAFKIPASDVLMSAGGVIIGNGGKICGEAMAPTNARLQEMQRVQGPFHLVISVGKATQAGVSWFVDFYTGKGFMKKYGSMEEFAKTKGQICDPLAKQQVGAGEVIVGEVSPALYTCEGGVATDEGVVLKQTRQGQTEPIPGLFAAGEVAAAPFNNLWNVSGIPLMYCVYSGRLAAASVCENMTAEGITGFHAIYVSTVSKLAEMRSHPPELDAVAAAEKPLEELTKDELISKIKELQKGGAVAAGPPADTGPPGITLEELAKHNTKADPWVCINGEVYDVTNWINIHPGGVQAIEAYLGKDASDEWNTIHTKPGIIKNNLKHLIVIGKLGAGGGGGGGGGAPAAAAPSGFADLAEVAKHNKKEDAWLVLDGMVVDVTRFIPVHPGGVEAICSLLGADASDEWHGIHGADLSKFRAQEKGPQGPIVLGNLIGGTVSAPPAGGDGDSGPTPDPEYGAIPIPVIGALLYMVKAIIEMILRTVFFTGNFVFKFDNNRNGTIRSAIFLLFFTIVHVSGNAWDFMMGPFEANGEDYFFYRQRVSGIHFGEGKYKLDIVPSIGNPLHLLEANFIELYLLLAAMLHVSVALKRSWDISMNYTLWSGRWNMMLSGLVILTFMTKHLSDFRLFPEDSYKLTKIRPAPFGANPLGLIQGHMWTDPSVPEIVVTDLYSREHDVFTDPKNLFFYITAIVCFMFHMIKGWEKLIPADVMMIPVKHRPAVKYIGWLLAVAIGSMYSTVAIGSAIETPANLVQCLTKNVSSCYCPYGEGKCLDTTYSQVDEWMKMLR
jgi:cytochrome b involved in lipid metabolism/aspartate oxidase